MISDDPAADHEADEALRDARSRFIAGFTQRHSAMMKLLDSAQAVGRSDTGPLREAAHKIAGLAGVLGFPSVSEHASALEVVLLEPAADFAAAKSALERMGAGFTRDLSGTAPSWAQAPAPTSAKILLVEDDEEQRRVASSGLKAAGYRVVTAASGTEAVVSAVAERPNLIVLDVDLPGLDGMTVCRQLKSNPAVSSIPVIFCTARSGLMDRMAGLTLGADDYVTKPFEPGDLLLRIRMQLTRPAATDTAKPATVVEGAMPYEMFAASARSTLAKESVSLAIIRVTHSDHDRLAADLAHNLRRRDVVGIFDPLHLLVLVPGFTAAAAKAAVQGVATASKAVVAIGAAESLGVGDSLDALLSRADIALAEERVARSGSWGKTTVLLAEDDPDVLHIVDARLKAAGYRTVIAFDGEQTLAAVEKETPSVMLLDLMMPKLTGFDVLTKLRDRRGPRPRTIVMSARGRNQDVTRSFELGADDYLTKPFNTDELVARVARLTR